MHRQIVPHYILWVATLTRSEAKQRIHDVGLRATAPRVAVLQLLSTAGKPLSHSEVVAAIGDEAWDQATLYRNLQKLVEVELARVASQIGGVTRYEARFGDEHPHPHFACRICGKVSCLPEAMFTCAVDERWKRSLQTSELQLIGECPDCITPKVRGRKST